jgi:mannose-6-phosphate isomerase-like protein (cupin superfamily)
MAMAIGSREVGRSLNHPDEHIAKGGVEIDIIQLGDFKVKRASYPPGWRFSINMGAERCYDTHVGYTLSGQMRGVLDDGSEFEFTAGDVFTIPAGHDAWVVGDEPCVIVQFDEGESAARRFNVPSAVAKTV